MVLMNKKIISSVIFVSLFCLANFVFAQVTIEDPLGDIGLGGLLTKIATGVAGVVGAVAVVMIIVAGIFYLTSAGSPERIGVAKKTLIYAIVGITIAIAAEAIVTAIKGIMGI